MRFEGLAGEFSQHDFGEVRVRYQDGTEREVHFFASRLKYSRWVEVTLVHRRARRNAGADARRSSRRVWRRFPWSAVFDRPKTVALHVGSRWRRHGMESDVCRRGARSRAGRRSVLAVSAARERRVENLVGWVKGSFFKQRRFLDREDLERQLREWLTEANTVRPSRATGVPPAARMADERARLRPLKSRAGRSRAAHSR